MIFSLTGGIASGKSIVSKVFAEEGVGIVDADDIARLLVVPGSPLLDVLAASFGAEIIRDGELDRKLLGNRVFGSPVNLTKLDRIMLPPIRAKAHELLEERSKTHEWVCFDAPTLFENGMLDYRPIVVVATSPERQLAQVMRRGFDLKEARARIDCQLPTEEKVRRADYVIENYGTVPELRAHARNLLGVLRRHPAPSGV
jgi:dephospho-CoA kinase